MDKKVYNKPSLKLEVFTPNEYIATCWYIKAGDCFKRIYRGTDGAKIKYEDAIYTHTAHSNNVPNEGHFKTEGEGSMIVQLPDEQTAPISGQRWYSYSGGSWPGNSMTISENNGFSLIGTYYEYDGHRFTNTNESNAS